MWAESDQVGDMSIRNALAGTAVVAVLALTVGACGGSSKPLGARSSTTPTTPASGSNVVLASVRTTAAAKTAHMSMSVETDGSGPTAFSLDAEGAIDFQTGNSQFTAKLGGTASTFLPDGLEMRIIDGVAYMKLPAGLAGLFGGGSGGDKWISVSAPAGSNSGANPFGGVGRSDPASVLSGLERISNDVKDVGTEMVRGVETTHYHATLDLKKSISRIDSGELPPGLRDKADALLGNAPAIPVDVFVDSDGRVRRIATTVDLGSVAAGVSGVSGASGLGDLPTMHVTVDFYDFGAPVNVVAPPADQIVEMPKLGDLGGLGDFGGISGGAGAPNAGGAAA
jgi:hypothetical protein